MTLLPFGLSLRASCALALVAALGGCQRTAPLASAAPATVTSTKLDLEWRLASGGGAAPSPSLASRFVRGVSVDGGGRLVVRHPTTLSISEDEGVTFRHLAVLDEADPRILDASNAVSDGPVLAVTYGSTLFLSRDDGAHFAQSVLPFAPQENAGLALGGGRIFVAGREGLAILKADGRREAVKELGPVFEVFARNETVVARVGSGLEISFDGGATFEHRNGDSVPTVADDGVYVLEPSVDGKGVVVRCITKPSAREPLSDRTLGTSLPLNASSLRLAVREGRILITGTETNGPTRRFFAYTSLDGGASYAPIEVPSAFANGAPILAAATKNGFFVAANDGTFGAHSAGGLVVLEPARPARIAPVTHPFNGNGFLTVQSDAEHLYAMGAAAWSGSSDGARSWVSTELPANWFPYPGLEAVLSSSVKAVRDPSQSSVAWTVGAEDGWHVTQVGEGGRMASLGGLLAVCSPQRREALLDVTGARRTIALRDATLLDCAGTNAGLFAFYEDGLLFVDRDGARRVWTSYESLGGVPSNAQATVVTRSGPEGELHILDVGGRLFSSYDLKAWKERGSAGAWDKAKPQLAAVDDLLISFVTGGDLVDGLAASVDGGQTWTPLSPPPGNGNFRNADYSLAVSRTTICLAPQGEKVRGRFLPSYCADLKRPE
jgi:hypothetical protein